MCWAGITWPNFTRILVYPVGVIVSVSGACVCACVCPCLEWVQSFIDSHTISLLHLYLLTKAAYRVYRAIIVVLSIDHPTNYATKPKDPSVYVLVFLGIVRGNQSPFNLYTAARGDDNTNASSSGASNSAWDMLGWVTSVRLAARGFVGSKEQK